MAFVTRPQRTTIKALTLLALVLGLSACSIDMGDNAPEARQLGKTVVFHASDPAAVSLASDRSQLFEFFAEWCGTCQAIAPTVHALEAEYEGRIDFVYLDIDDPACASFKATLEYETQPYLVLVDETGAVVKRWQGLVDREELVTAFGRQLTKEPDALDAPGSSQ
jgi:thiol-disulfide isomerase/thioredoxin